MAIVEIQVRTRTRKLAMSLITSLSILVMSMILISTVRKYPKLRGDVEKIMVVATKS